MADATAAAILRAADPDTALLGGGAPNWSGYGQVYRFVTPGIDVKAYNDSVPAAQQVGATDQVDLMDIDPQTVILAWSVTIETAAGASCTAHLRVGTTQLNTGAINCNSTGQTRGGPKSPTPDATGDTAQKLNFEFLAAPGNTKFRVFLLTADMREEFNT